MEVVLENKTKVVNYKFPAKNVSDNKNVWRVDLPNLDLDAGVYDIYAVLNFYGLSFSTKANSLYVSEPIYVTWTIDWEGYDVNDNYLEALNEIANKYKIPMTQLFNPRIFVTAYKDKFGVRNYESEKNNLIGSLDKTIKDSEESFSAIEVESQESFLFSGLQDVTNPARAQYLTGWVKQRRDSYGDEIGLHLHMFPDLVLDARVEAKLQPVWGGGWTEGYDVLTTAYDYEDMVKILNRAKGWFVSQDLGIPKSYRAGGWFANEVTLKALEATGFLIDSSGRTKYSFGLNNVQGPWDLQATTQPYYPSMNDQNVQGEEGESLRILEIPNNGGDTFAFSAKEMINRFDKNFNGKPLLEPKQITYLTHPHWFYPDRQNKIRQVFDGIQKWNYELDQGPVVYTTLMGVYRNLKTK